jgi:hypothetical protein
MKNLLLILILLVVTVSYGSSPPGETAKDKITVQTDNHIVCVNLTAIAVQDAFMAVEAVPQVINVTQHSTEVKDVPVREVTYILKISVTNAASRYATELKAENAVTICSSDRLNNKVIKTPLLLQNANGVTNKSTMLPNIDLVNWVITTVFYSGNNTNLQYKFQRNYQNTNYGYPLSADRQETSQQFAVFS